MPRKARLSFCSPPDGGRTIVPTRTTNDSLREVINVEEKVPGEPDCDSVS